MIHPKLDRLMTRHKMRVARAGFEIQEDMSQEEFAKLMTTLKIQAQEISMVIANFRCQKCGVYKNLQYHHLILRKAKYFMNKQRYVTQRYYWANVIILCRDCHAEYHNFQGDKVNSLVIDEDKIQKLKKKYGGKNETTRTR